MIVKAPGALGGRLQQRVWGLKPHTKMGGFRGARPPNNRIKFQNKIQAKIKYKIKAQEHKNPFQNIAHFSCFCNQIDKIIPIFERLYLKKYNNKN